MFTICNRRCPFVWPEVANNPDPHPFSGVPTYLLNNHAESTFETVQCARGLGQGDLRTTVHMYMTTYKQPCMCIFKI